MKRAAVDNDLELLRLRLKKADPRQADFRRYGQTVIPIVAGLAAIWLWMRRRRAVHSLQDLLVHGLNELNRSERLLPPALEKMARQASNPELRKALEAHCAETEAHVERLERVFRSIGVRPRTGGPATAVAGVVAEGERLLGRRNVDADVRDAWIVATAQRVEHLEIASYGTLRTYAETLGYTYAAQLLQQTLEEERATDVKLTHLAERFINPQTIRHAPAM